jgi:hypothetical protein
MKRTVFLLVFCLFAFVYASAQDAGSWGLSLLMTKSFPIAESTSNFAPDNDPAMLVAFPNFTLISGGGIGVVYREQLTYLRGEIRMAHHYPQGAGGAIAPLGADVGGGVMLDILPWLSWRADVCGGAYTLVVRKSGPGVPVLSDYGLLASFRTGLEMRFGAFLLDILAEYVNYVGTYQGVGVTVGGGIQTGSP